MEYSTILPFSWIFGDLYTTETIFWWSIWDNHIFVIYKRETRRQIKTMINRNNFYRIWSARRVTLRNIRTVNLISPIWKFVEKDALDSQQVNCKHCKTSWVNLNESTTVLILHVMRHHIDLLTEAEKQKIFGQSV